MTKATSAKPKKRVCKVCIALPYLEPGTEPELGAVYRPRVDRPAPHPGPRCATHKRERRDQIKVKNHERRVETIYGISYEFYWMLYDSQGGKCYICQRATGARKKLAVDHDHSCCKGPTSCGKCVRGLLCSPCNQGVIGHLFNSVEALQRAIDYLNDPPARRLTRASA